VNVITRELLSADHQARTQSAPDSVVNAQTDPVLEEPDQSREMKDTTKQGNETESQTLNDEFCYDKDYTENAMDKTILVDELLVKPDDENDWKNEDVVNLIDYKLKIVGIDVVNIEKEIKEDEIISCKVKIQPTQLKNIESESFPFINCRWKPHR
jgi:hypothetical protein